MFQNIHHVTILALSVIALFATPAWSIDKTAPLLFVSVATAALADVGMNRLRGKKLFFPTTAVITGLIVGLLFAPDLPLHIPLVASFFAILSKHALKLNRKHLFNPAGFGTMVALFLFPGTLGWWGGISIIPVTLLGIFILYKLRNVQHVFSFFLLYALTSLVHGLITGQPFSFILPLLTSILLSGAFFFFMFFMLTEPKTAPTTGRARILYGAIAAIAAFGFSLAIPNGFIYGLLLANLSAPFLDTTFKKRKRES